MRISDCSSDVLLFRSRAILGRNCVIGRGAYSGPGVQMGDNCKVQNYALVYEPAVLESGVFVGPAVVLTNDTFPRAINPAGSQKSGDDWDVVGVTGSEERRSGKEGVSPDRYRGDD